MSSTAAYPAGSERAGRSSGSVRFVIHAASTEECERLLADFVRYCEIESPSGRERELADALSDDLRGLGLEVDEDEAGNLLARIPGPEAAPTILLCAHMDTVPLDAPVEVV